MHHKTLWETYSYIFLLAKETHADVIPERGALRDSKRCHSILIHGHIEIPVCLHHAAGCQDGLMEPNTHTEYFSKRYKLII